MLAVIDSPALTPRFIQATSSSAPMRHGRPFLTCGGGLDSGTR
jgi:hypothetical protein